MTKKTFIAVFAVAAIAFAGSPLETSAQTNYYYIPGNYQTTYKPVTPITYTHGSTQMTEAQLIAYLQQLIVQLQLQLAAQGGNQYYYGSGYGYSQGYVIGEPRSSRGSRNYNDDEPEVETDRARDIDSYEAELSGYVDMMDFEDGEVFFVYGTDEDDIEDVEDDFDSYRDVDEDGDNLQKVRVDSSLDGDDDFEKMVYNLEEDTDYYFQICVGFEDEDGDDKIICGGVEEFTTDRD